MNLDALLERLIDDFHERDLPALTSRDAEVRHLSGKASVVVGMRRAGKTWFCYQQMHELIRRGLPKTRLLYLNFEDERLLPFDASHFQEILDVYYRKFPGHTRQVCHVFLDEAQRIAGWDRFVRRVLDTEPLRVWITGSSSRLLSAEIASSLRGRSLATEIFPFSFREFLRFHGVAAGRGVRFGAALRATLQHMAERYLAVGGFPEVQHADEETWRQVLRNYLDVVILRDVVERHGVSNVVALRALIRHLIAAPATRFSVNRFHNTLRSQAIPCAKNDLHLFLAHLGDAFLIYLVPIHARSHRARLVNPRKVYAVDSGLVGAMSYRMTGDRGALLENLVYLHLRRQGLMPEYYVTDAGHEVDFVLAPTREEGSRLIQVCWSVRSPDTRRREEEALRTAMAELRLREGTIVTWRDDETTRDGVRIIPAWKWLLAPAAGL